MNPTSSAAVSVVIPVYNSAGTIASCIESIVAQQLTDIEVVVVDDGSTDGSGGICDGYAAADARIKVVHQPNQGRTAARWRGTSMACGEWIAYVDSDDMLPKEALSDLLEQATDDTDRGLGNGHTLWPECRTSIPMADFRHLAVRAEGTIGVPWGSLYRRSVLSDYLFDIPRHIYNGEDYLFWLRLVFLTDKPVHVVYKSVYDKGDEHTSADFVWTAGYCQQLDRLRVASIPAEDYHLYADDALCDRLENLFAVAVWQRRQEWVHSPFYLGIRREMQERHRPMSWKQRFFLSLPYLRLRKLLVKIGT